MAVGEGFVEIGPDKVAVLTDMAVKDADIDESQAEEAVRRAEEAMRNEKMDDEEHAMVKAALQKSLALVRVKRRRTF
jgi:F-type H+-transporting ATPase subunit epsilon